MNNLIPTIQTTPTIQDFALALLSAWPEATKEGTGILYAQFAFETNDGKNCYGWNLGNVKYTPNCGTDYQALHGVFEYVNGQRVEIPADNPAAWFRAYSNLDEGMAVYVEARRSGQWRSVWHFVLGGSVEGYAYELHRMGYFTADAHVYSDAMKVKFNEWMKSNAFEEAKAKFFPSEENLEPEAEIVHPSIVVCEDCNDVGCPSCEIEVGHANAFE